MLGKEAEPLSARSDAYFLNLVNVVVVARRTLLLVQLPGHLTVAAAVTTECSPVRAIIT